MVDWIELFTGAPLQGSTEPGLAAASIEDIYKIDGDPREAYSAEEITKHRDAFLQRIAGNGNYEVPQKIGEGAFSEVYLVPRVKRKKRMKEDLTLAVKLFTIPQKVISAQFAHHEAGILRRAQPLGRNVAELWKFESEEPLTPLWMQYAQGENLQELILKDSLSRRKRLQTGASLYEVMGETHAQGIVHRDIKPLNVLLRKDSGVVLLDFGLASAKESGIIYDPFPSGEFYGTLGHFAPERIPPKMIGHKLANVFSEFYAQRSKENNEYTRGALLTMPHVDSFAYATVVGETCVGRNMLEGVSISDLLEYERDPDSRIEPYVDSMKREGYGNLVDGFVKAVDPNPVTRDLGEKLYQAIKSELTVKRLFAAPIGGWVYDKKTPVPLSQRRSPSGVHELL